MGRAMGRKDLSEGEERGESSVGSSVGVMYREWGSHLFVKHRS